MTDKTLRYFLAVADMMSISAAAKKLYISQPSLTQAISRLEASLGVELFFRSADGMMMTPYGKQLYQSASEIERLWNGFESYISTGNTVINGNLSLTTPSSLGAYILPAVLKQFNKSCPGIQCIIIEESFSRGVELVLEEKVDVGISAITRRVKNPMLQYFNLLRDPFVIITAKDAQWQKRKSAINYGEPYSTVDPSALYDQTWLLPMRGKVAMDVVDRFLEKAGISNLIISPNKVNQILTIKLVEVGEGVAIMPLSYINVEERENLNIYKPPDEYDAYWDICLIQQKNSPPNDLSDRFISIAQQTYRLINPQNSLDIRRLY